MLVQLDSPNGMLAVSSAWDDTIRLWGMNGDVVRIFKGTHDCPIELVAFSPDGGRLSSGAVDGTISLWDAASGAKIRTFGGYSAGASVAFSPNGAQLVWARHLGLWDAKGGGLIRAFEGHSGWVNSVAFSSDGTRVLSGSKDNTVKLWDAATAKVIHTFEGHSDEVSSVAFSSDGTRVLSGSADKTLKLWDAATGHLIRTFEGHSDGVNSVAFSPDGMRAVSAGKDESLKLWDLGSGRLILSIHAIASWAVVFSPNGTRLLSGGVDGRLTLSDAKTGKRIRTFGEQSVPIFSVPIASVAFSPDGARIASGDWDNKIKLWDAETGKLIRTFEGHSGWVELTTFSADGTRLLSASIDGTARIWNSTTGQLLVTLSSSSREWLAITPEGFFTASPGSTNLLAVVRGIEIFSVNQFYRALYSPHLVREKLAGDQNGEVREAVQGVDLAKLLDSGRRPPAFTIAAPADKSHASASPVNIRLQLESNPDPVEEVEVFVNGRQTTTPELRSATARMAATPSSERSLDVPLEQGKNQIIIIVRNKIGQSVSELVLFRDFPGLLDKNGTLYVLAIGVDKYDQLPHVCGAFGNESL